MKRNNPAGAHRNVSLRLFFILTVSFLFVGRGIHVSALPDEEGKISIATWNIRILSDKSRNDEELASICTIIRQFDFIAIQEVRDTEILDRMVGMLHDRFGLSYEYVASPPVGRGVKEMYAFLYNADKVFWKDKSFIFTDPGDLLIREPFTALFQAGNFDFYAVTIHTIFGKTIGGRRDEARLLKSVYMSVQDLDTEQDVLLMGDFNLPPGDEGFDGLSGIPGIIHLNTEKATTIHGSAYDNIWFQSQYTREYTGKWGILRFDETMYGNNDREASLAVSDHRPLWMRVYISGPDDD